MTLQGVDISSHQPVIDWTKVRAAGYDFAVVKCTGGVGYVNPLYQQQLAGARAVGMVVGHYHYDGEPSVGGGTAVEEAAYFLAHADIQPGELVALDAEERTTRDPVRYRRWLDVVGAATGAKVLFYSYASFITELGVKAWTPLKDAPLWFASYDDPPLPAPLPWQDWTVLQWSGGTTIPGIPNDTDANVYPGTREQLMTIGKPTAAPPVPSPYIAGWEQLWKTAQGKG